MTARRIALEQPVTDENFDEAAYLDANPDVAAAVAAGSMKSGLFHYRRFGRHEHRRRRAVYDITAMRARKMDRVRPLLRTDLVHRWNGDKVDYITEALRAETGIVDTANVSAHPYEDAVLALIDSLPDGLLLDCGAGKRPTYFENVVNYEIVDYDSTDVLGVAEELPFKDATFDAVLSLVVLEHVRDPFRSASEIVRVLKPGGKLICTVPLLQPLHGYPHHYYNMTHQGLRALFERSLHVDHQCVPDSSLPIWTLTWFLQNWANALPPKTREQFLKLPLRTFMAKPESFLEEPFVRLLPPASNFELANATMLFATKPASG